MHHISHVLSTAVTVLDLTVVDHICALVVCCLALKSQRKHTECAAENNHTHNMYVYYYNCCSTTAAAAAVAAAAVSCITNFAAIDELQSETVAYDLRLCPLLLLVAVVPLLLLLLLLL
jgi:hypothetical protein